MERYSFDEKSLAIIEKSCIPYAIFQLVNNRVVTIAISDGFCDLFEISREEARDQLDNHIYDKDHPDDVARLGDAALSFATEGGEYNIVYRSLIGDEYRIIHARGKHVYSSGGDRLAIIWYTDEGVYSGGKEELFDQVLRGMLVNSDTGIEKNYDPMTGLPGMNYFFKLAEDKRDRIISEGGMPALLYFDFNEMKNYNLRYGFAEGDRLILGMSNLLVSHFSNINCCRFGGDHFVVVTSTDGLEDTLKTIFKECKELNEGRSLSVRVGIYVHDMGDVSIGVACDRAKMACDTNRDSVSSAFNYFSEDMLRESRARHYILDNIDKAIREGWVTAYYQPLVRVANGRVCDEEALARWIDPVMGFLSPGDFIPVLEDAKLIYKLDLYVLDLVLKKMKIIEENGLYVVPCSVNISRSDFVSCDIVEEIRTRVDASGISRDKITIEITESSVGEDIEYIRKQVENLNELGFKVWMDDYGSGYSSPEILQSIAFDTIKLDMQFMRQFDKGEKSRIVISEVIRMALALGLETVVEGVETKEQVEFLKEVGATKMQGFYFCKPIPLDIILNRYKSGGQIGFDDPAMSDYYSTIGRVNLYDISISADEDKSFGDYFNTMPMAILEVGEKEFSVIRCNKPYHEAMISLFMEDDIYKKYAIEGYEKGAGRGIMRAILKTCEEGGQQIIDEKISGGRTAHAVVRRITENPVTNTKAVAVVILSISEDRTGDRNLTYAAVAQALSADYLYLYYVDLKTEEFIEYRPDAGRSDMLMERRGEDFFNASRRDAMELIYDEDRESFITIFTRENVLGEIETHGVFTFTYRLLIEGEPVYVNMKISAIGEDRSHIIIGVNNVDVQMKQKEAEEREREERIAYTRFAALASDIICFYTVDIESDHYREFDATKSYESLGMAKEGKDFFGETLRNGKRVILSEDQESFFEAFTKENVLGTIEKKGTFSVNYRLMFSGEAHRMRLKAAKVVEDGKPQLIIAVSDLEVLEG